MSYVNSFKELIVYQKAYKLAMEIFEISKDFPKEEKYSLTDHKAFITIRNIQYRGIMGKKTIFKIICK
jgi:hypothetical protein